MNTQVKTAGDAADDGRFFDAFTKTMLTIMFSLLVIIFATGKYMTAHKMTGMGTDDIVNNLGSAAAHTEHHPFIDLPGDAELSAFSVANFFAGMIVGYKWLKLFGNKP